MEESIAILLAGTPVELYGFMSTTILHFGPAHPAAHGVLRSILWLSGEWVTVLLPIRLVALPGPGISRAWVFSPYPLADLATPVLELPRPGWLFRLRSGEGSEPLSCMNPYLNELGTPYFEVLQG